MRFVGSLAVLLVTLSLALAEAPKPVIHFPDTPVAPVPIPDPATPIRLPKGQYYCVTCDRPLLVLPSGAGSATVMARKGPLALPTEVVLGWKPDPADPDFVTFADAYVYVIKAAKTGLVNIEFIPALNALDAAGKQVPLTVADVQRKQLDVDAGDGPLPPPPPPPPPVPIDPFVVALQAAYNGDTATNMPKPAALAQLVALRQQAAKQAQNSKAVAKLYDVHNNVHNVIQQVMGDDLKATRRAVANHWTLPVNVDTPLDDAMRARLVAEYDAVARALAQVKP